MLTDKKIQTAINSFSIACMNNVKWERVMYQLNSYFDKEQLFVIGKPVWTDRERPIDFRKDQISKTGITDPGLFGNDREEYKEIEYLKLCKDRSDAKAIESFKAWCSENNIEVTQDLYIYGYKG